MHDCRFNAFQETAYRGNRRDKDTVVCQEFMGRPANFVGAMLVFVLFFNRPFFEPETVPNFFAHPFLERGDIKDGINAVEVSACMLAKS